MSAGRNMPQRGFQTDQGLRHGRVMLAMKGAQFVENLMTLLQSRMAEHLPAGNHLEGAAAKARRDLDAGVAGVLARGPPLHGHGAEVMIADGQVVGDTQDGSAKLAVGAAAQRAVAEIDLVALVAGGTQTRAAGNAA